MKPKTLMVRCAPGIMLPAPAGTIINSPRRYLTMDASQVMNNSFIRGRIRKGDLLVVDEKSETPTEGKADTPIKKTSSTKKEG